MVQRDLFVLSNENRIQEFVAESGRCDDSYESLLGVGFYAAQPAQAPYLGIQLHVIPSFLKEKFYADLSKGNLGPLSQDSILLGAGLDRREVRHAMENIGRWLLCPAHPAGTGHQTPGHIPTQSQSDGLQAGTQLGDEIACYFRSLFGNINSLRPDTVLIALDPELLGSRFQCLPSAFLDEAMLWILEEGVHPRVALCLPREEQVNYILGKYRTFVTSSHSFCGIMVRV